MKTIPAKDLSTHSESLLRDIKKQKAACLTDGDGHAAAYLVAADAYDSLQTRMRLLEGIARGEKAIREGRVFTQAQAKKKMARWLKTK